LRTAVRGMRAAPVEEEELGRRVTRGAEITSKFLFAGVAELADAPDSKSGYRKAVKVRFLSPAPGFFASRNDQEGQIPFVPKAG
jgi:hypothetical protein